MADPEIQVDSLIGSRPEFKTYHHIRKKDGKISVEPVLEPFGKAKTSGDDESSYALVINRNYTAENQGEATSVTLQVNSPSLLKAFREIVKSYPTVASDFKSPFELQSPFQMLVHYWDDLDEYRRETDDMVMRRDLNLLFDFMAHEIGPERDKVVSMVKKGQIGYLTAWVIFRPGDLVYTEEMKHGWLLRCVKTAYEESKSIGPYLEVHCTYTDYDGVSMGRAKRVIQIRQKRQFGQENPAQITDLPVYPRKFVDAGKHMEERLTERGRRFLECKGTSIKAYDGLAQYLNEPPWNFWHPEMAEFDGVWLPYTVLSPNRSYLGIID
jgi:hypothetical protein